MIYFKTISILNSDNETIENSIRKYSLKRHGKLDMKQSSSYITEDDKYFLGAETEKYLTITRLRTPFENVLPKLIVRFEKNNFKIYKIRYSFPSNLIYATLILSIILNIVHLIVSGSIGGNISFVILISIVFILMTLIEVKFTTRRINKVIEL